MPIVQLKTWMIVILLCTAPRFAHSYDMSRYQPEQLDELLGTAENKNLTLITPRKLLLEVYLASYAYTCDTSILKAALTLQGAPREALEHVAISHCVNVTTLRSGITLPMFIQDQVATHLPKEATVGSRISLYVDYLYQGPQGAGFLINEFSEK
ncbi:MAG: hypothetical protein OEW08_11990 [Gammaproteobacteria bacterium]|nr:hypothetical protein [Gammaproteobacteria bacterium]